MQSEAYPQKGLTAAEVQERMEKGLGNHTDVSAGKSVKEIILSNTFTLFNLIFLIIAVLLCVVGSFRNLTFLPVVIGNTLVGIIQEIRAKKVLDQMSLLNAPHAVVLRDGEKQKIRSEELVKDDVVCFSAGDQICADARVLEGHVMANEALLTGEEDEIGKDPGDSLLSGSFVVSGECQAVLEKVGAESYIAGLTAQAKKADEGEQSEMIRSINKIVKWIGILLVPIGAVLFYQSYYVAQVSFKESVVAMVAAVIGMIPEGLYLLTTAALALGTIRLARQKVLLNDMKSIEALARVDVLCVDKTGTITEPGMQVVKLVAAADAAEISKYHKTQINEEIQTNRGTRENRETQGNREEQENSETQGNRETQQNDRMQKTGQNPVEQNWEERLYAYVCAARDNNATMDALKDWFLQDGSKKNTEGNVLAVMPFSSSVKYGTVTFSSGTGILGAPEFVLKEHFEEYRNFIENYAAQGYRVLVYAFFESNRQGEMADCFPAKVQKAPTAESGLPTDLRPLGFVVLSNKIRENAEETFAYFKKQGVEIKVISGDHPETVSEIARLAGIENAQKAIDASLWKDNAQLEKAAEEYTVFGRVTPKQKQELVAALKKKGHTVAMTGDGVNDILAMKEADCGIAMASGSEAASSAARLVLLDSDFARMPGVVGEGRRVVNNVQRSASLFLVKNIFSLLLSIMSSLLLITYPLEPAHISLISMFTIGLPGFLLALENNHNRIEGHFLKNVLKKALPAGLTDAIVVGSLVICGRVFALPKDDIATAGTLILAVVGFMILRRISLPFNKYRTFVYLLNLLGMALSFAFIPDFFAIVWIPATSVLLTIMFSFAAESLFRLLTGILDRTEKRPRVSREKRVKSLKTTLKRAKKK